MQLLLFGKVAEEEKNAFHPACPATLHSKTKLPALLGPQVLREPAFIKQMQAVLVL